MAGDAFKPVLPGAQLEIPAEAYNSFLDSAKFVKGQRHNQAQGEGENARQAGIVKVKNTTDQNLGRFNILGLSRPIILPGDNLLEFKQRPTFWGVLPALPDHETRFCILVDPLKPGAIGRAVVSGVSVCRLFVDDDLDWESAGTDVGQTGYLKLAPGGGAQVLWREPGEGLVWGIVRIPAIVPSYARAGFFAQTAGLLGQLRQVGLSPPLLDSVAGGHTIVGGAGGAVLQIGSDGLYAVHVSAEVSAVNQLAREIHLVLYRQRGIGTLIRLSVQMPFWVGYSATLQTSTSVFSHVSMSGHVDLRTGDKLSIWVENGTYTGTDGPQVGGQIFLHRIGACVDPGAPDVIPVPPPP